MMQKLLDRAIVVNQEIVSWRLIDQGVIFLHKKKRVFYELNKTATFIWLQANGKTCVKEIIKALMSKFNLTKKIAEEDTIEFVTEAVKKKILLLV